MNGLRGKLVYRGKIFNIYQWRQKLFDGSYATFERATRPSIAQIIAVIGRKIAISSEFQPDFTKRMPSLLGGVFEEGEAPLSAAKRELLEESGMTAKRWKLIKLFKFSGKLKYDVYLYAAMGCKVVAKQQLDAGEDIRVRLISLPQLISMAERMRTGMETKKYLTELKYVPSKKRQLERLLFDRK